MANLETLNREGCDPTQHIWSRRNFLGLAGWGAVLGSLSIGTAAFGRFMYPRVLYEPNTILKLGKPEEYAINDVSEKWLRDYGIWLVRFSAGGLHAVITMCTDIG